MTVGVQLPLGVQLRATADFDSYLAGPNGDAVAAARALARGDECGVYLWSGTGAGKSHLLQAACRMACERGLRGVYLPLADVATAGPTVLDGLTEFDVVCLDDVDAIAGQRAWEEALVGAFDALRARRRGLLTAGSAAPAGLELVLADLRSRLAWGAVYALRELDDDAKHRLLIRGAAERGLQMPDEVARFVLRRGARDLPALFAVLERLDRASLAAQRPLTVPFVKQVLGH